MKKYIFILGVLILFIGINTAFGETSFSKAIRTCEKYSQSGSIPYQGQVFNILVTVEKAKNDKCIYKEKIYQNNKYQMLTCNFNQSDLGFIADSMSKYSDKYKKEISSNLIFNAKMTTNAEVFQKYLADPHYCNITHSKK